MNEQKHCDELLAYFSDYLDGDLEDTVCGELEEHLKECQNCRIVVDTLRKTIDIYHVTYGKLGLPDSLRNKLFYRLDLKEHLNP
jgi:predicted anti-sigma-YlaC factor YlaD